MSLFGRQDAIESESDYISADDSDRIKVETEDNEEEITPEARLSETSPTQIETSTASLHEIDDVSINDESTSTLEADQGTETKEANLKPATGPGNKWLRNTENEIAISDGITKAAARNLTEHLLNAHGVAARQYSAIRPGSPKEWKKKRTWVSDWLPPIRWTSWPFPVGTVPTRSKKVWADSTRTAPESTPREELEQELFGVMLKQARTKWNKVERQNEAGESSSDQWQKPTSVQSSSASSVQPMKSESTKTGDSYQVGGENRESTKHTRKRKREDPEDPVFSADDDRALRILQPIIRSTVSKLDHLLTSVHQSKIRVYRVAPTDGKNPAGDDSIKSEADAGNESPSGSEPERGGSRASSKSRGTSRSRASSAASTSQFKFLQPRDWSEVLGLAALVDISPAVVSRAAIRCTEIFNEGMSFQELHEEESAADEAPVPIVFAPEKIKPMPSNDQSDPRLLPAKGKWSWTFEDSTCPFPDCRWHGRSLQSKGLRTHLTKKHHWTERDWDRPVRNAKELVSGKSGGVHIDGFLQPITFKTGWRGRAKTSLPKSTEISAPPEKPATPIKDLPVQPGLLDPQAHVSIDLDSASSNIMETGNAFKNLFS